MTVEYLKDGNKPALKSFAVLNVVIFWAVFVSHVDMSTIPDLLRSISIKDGLIALIAPLATFLLDGLLSPNVKTRLVYWRWHHPLPGCRAFSKHLLRESRADPQLLIQQWGPLPEAPADQNRLWYRVFKQVETEVRVHEAHRAWLLSRDLTGYAALFFACLGIPTIIMDTPTTTAAWYIITLFSLYLLSMTAAQTYGNQLVRNVLAIASGSTTQTTPHL